MITEIPEPQYQDDLGTFLGDLRSLVFSSQSKAARHFGLAPSTISRYEASQLAPDADYMFELAYLVGLRLAESGASSDVGHRYRARLIDRVNEAIRWCYAEVQPLRHWQDMCERIQRSEAADSSMPATNTKSGERIVDWSEAPETGRYFGRDIQLRELARWIAEERCKLVAVLGMGGIGKTLLTTKAAEQMQIQFDCLVWRSLRNAPSLNEIMESLCLALVDPDEYGSEGRSCAQLQQRLMEVLRTRRCLIILDNLESIMDDEETQIGEFTVGYEDYGSFFHAVAQGRHQSCLVFTSRERPAMLDEIETTSGPVRSYHLLGLSTDDGVQLLKERRLVGNRRHWQALISAYSGNPLLLKIIAQSIEDLFSGSIALFLEQESLVFGSVRRLLERQFRRLSPLAPELMYWLAVRREPQSVSDLYQALLQQPAMEAMLEAIQALRRLSLVEQMEQRLLLQNVVLEYVITDLVTRIVSEIVEQRLHLLHRIALLGANAPDQIRRVQSRLVLQPIAEGLLQALDGETAVYRQLTDLLAQLQAASSGDRSYAAGNLLNLMLHMGFDVSGQDFSGLAIRQAYLVSAALHNVDFRGANLEGSVFDTLFTGVTAVAISNDARWLAISTGRRIQIWARDDAHLHAVYDGHADLIWSVAFDTAGDLLYSSGMDGVVRCWSLGGDAHTRVFHGDGEGIWSVAAGAGDDWIAGGSEEGKLYLWRTEDGERQWHVAGHEGAVRALVSSPNGQLLASGGDDGTVSVWDVATGHRLAGFATGSRSISAVAFCSEDGRQIAAGGTDGVIKVWDLRRGRLLRTLSNQSAADDVVEETKPSLSTLACARDGTLCVGGFADGLVRLWSLPEGQLISVLRGHTLSVCSVAVDTATNTVVSGSYDRTVRLWDAKSGSSLRTLYGHTFQIRALAFHPHGDSFAAAGTDYSIHLWQGADDQASSTLRGHTRWVSAVDYCPQGRRLASGSYDRTIRLWDLESGREERRIDCHRHWVWSVAFSPDGRVLASADANGQICLTDISNGALIRSVEAHAAGISCLAFHPPGALLASGGEDQAIRLWDTRDGILQREILDHDSPLIGIAFSPNGRTLLSASEDGWLCLWRTEDGRSIRRWRSESQRISGLALSPDGKCCAVAEGSHRVTLWDLESQSILCTLRDHAAHVSALGFHPDGRLLASAGHNGVIRLWRTADGAPIGTRRLHRPYEGMDITEATGLNPHEVELLKALGAIQN